MAWWCGSHSPLLYGHLDANAPGEISHIEHRVTLHMAANGTVSPVSSPCLLSWCCVSSLSSLLFFTLLWCLQCSLSILYEEAVVCALCKCCDIWAPSLVKFISSFFFSFPFSLSVCFCKLPPPLIQQRCLTKKTLCKVRFYNWKHEKNWIVGIYEASAGC